MRFEDAFCDEIIKQAGIAHAIKRKLAKHTAKEVGKQYAKGLVPGAVAGAAGSAVPWVFGSNEDAPWTDLISGLLVGGNPVTTVTTGHYRRKAKEKSILKDLLTGALIGGFASALTGRVAPGLRGYALRHPAVPAAIGGATGAAIPSVYSEKGDITPALLGAMGGAAIGGGGTALANLLMKRRPGLAKAISEEVLSKR